MFSPRRIVVSCVSLVLLCLPALAQFNGAPSKIPYQGHLTMADGSPVPDKSYSVTFGLYTSSSAPTPIWTEVQSVSTVDGVFNVTLGTNTSLDGVAFDQQLWLGTKIATLSELSPRTALQSVPYALSLRNFRIIPDSPNDAPSIIGGYHLNKTSPGVEGATIAGGGQTAALVMPNRVTGNY